MESVLDGLKVSLAEEIKRAKEYEEQEEWGYESEAEYDEILSRTSAYIGEIFKIYEEYGGYQTVVVGDSRVCEVNGKTYNTSEQFIEGYKALTVEDMRERNIDVDVDKIKLVSQETLSYYNVRLEE